MNNNPNQPNNNVNPDGQPTVIDPNAVNQELNVVPPVENTPPIVQEVGTVQPELLEPQPQVQPINEPVSQQVAQQPVQQSVVTAQSTIPSQPQVVNSETTVEKVQTIKQTPTPQPNGNNNQPPQQPVTTPPIQEEPKGSKWKRIGAGILFVLLFAFVYFLPEITDYINYLQNKQNIEKEEDITTGKMTCKLSKTTDTLNVDITVVFNFSNRKLKALTFTTESSGESGADEAEISELSSTCTLLKQETVNLEGVEITCNSGNTSVRSVQYIDYTIINLDEVDAAYTEAGGVYPEFKKDQDISGIKKNMESAKYSCVITK